MAEADDAARAAERAAREAYGRLVALLARGDGDLVAAEDALAEAFVAALSSWPQRGVPDEPEAWLLAVGRRRSIDRHRRTSVRDEHAPALAQLVEETQGAVRVPDRRFDLLLVCAHPSIDPSVRAPLMLQTVLGLNAQQIGQAFLIAPKTMGQRLSRAKHKIRAAAIPFEVPERRRRERLGVVCEAIYAAFTTGYGDGAPRRQGLAEEAIWLARLAHAESGEHPETAGLLALLLFIEARRPARRDEAGEYVPLDEQDPKRWDWSAIAQAERLLWSAAARKEPGRFQLEAAIQSAHVLGARVGRTDWAAVSELYARLRSYADTIGARLGHIAARAESEGAAAAYEALAGWDEASISTHQSYWALRARLEQRLGHDPDRAFERAIALSDDPAVQRFLRRRWRAHGSDS